MNESDPINHPSHYAGANGIEAIDSIEAFNLNFALGNVVKYVMRAGRKEGEDDIIDLRKAQWYLAREIARRLHSEEGAMA